MKKKIFICTIVIFVIFILIIDSVIVPVKTTKTWFHDGVVIGGMRPAVGHYEYYHYNIYGKRIKISKEQMAIYMGVINWYLLNQKEK